MLRTPGTKTASTLFGLAVVGWGVAGFVTGLLIVSSVLIEVTAQHGSQETSSQGQAVQTTPSGRVFGSDAGLVLNFIKPDKTTDFEATVAKLKQALEKSDKPERKQQAASWKVFRAVEPSGNGSVLYIFTIDPAVKGADYTVSTILAETFPTEVQTLYKPYVESYATGQNFVNLTLVAALGNDATR